MNGYWGQTLKKKFPPKFIMVMGIGLQTYILKLSTTPISLKLKV